MATIAARATYTPHHVASDSNTARTKPHSTREDLGGCIVFMATHAIAIDDRSRTPTMPTRNAGTERYSGVSPVRMAFTRTKPASYLHSSHHPCVATVVRQTGFAMGSLGALRANHALHVQQARPHQKCREGLPSPLTRMSNAVPHARCTTIHA